jgi:acetyl-CoA carboxylase biotin carboxyl carrier protein
MSMMKIKAEVTGSVWKVLKQPGDPVVAGEEILLLESMKMEIPVIAEDGGHVDTVHVKEGDAITEGQIVVTIRA